MSDVAAPETSGTIGQRIRLLLIENLEDCARSVQSMLARVRSPEFDVVWDASFASGLNRLAKGTFDVVLLDLSLPDGAGLSNVQQASIAAPHVPIIVLSGVDDERVAVEAVHEGAQDYLVRDRLTGQLLARAVRYAIERQAAENALFDAEEKYRGIFEHIVEGIFQTTPDGRYLSANTALARIYGYSTPEQLMASIQDISRSLYVEPGRRDAFVRLMEQNDVVTGFQSEIYRKDGTRIWISENVRAIRDAQGRLKCYEGTVEDITERRRIEEELRNSEALYHSLVENLPQNIFRKDLEGRFTFCNQRFCQTVGRTSEEIVGRTDHELFPPELAEKYHNDDLLVMRGGKPYETVEENRLPGGATHYVQVVKTPLFDARGVTIGLQGIFWDITEKREAEERERRANAELARSREELSVKNAQMEEDIRMAREIQQAILPQQYPAFPRDAAPGASVVQFHHRYAPSGAVGGDYFTLIPLSPTTVGVFICDVMGHGVRSALVTAMIRALVEELIPKAGDAGDLLTHLNHDLRAILKQTGSPMYATAFYLIVDLVTGQAQFANAGHPRQLVLDHATNQVSYLPPSKAQKKPPLGLMDAVRYTASNTTLTPGQLVILYTDGVIEVEGADQRFYGLESLTASTQRHAALALPALIEALIADVKSFSSTGDFDDDICLVGMELKALLPAPPPEGAIGL